jgi:O-antigen ligase
VSNLTDFFRDRIQLNSALIVLSFVSVLLLTSQSAASYATYLLALSMLLTVRQWDDAFRVPSVWLLAVLLGYLFLSSFWSDPFAPREAFSIFVRALLVFLFVMAVAECRQRGQLRRWLGRALALVGTAAVIAALAVFYAAPPLDGRLNGLGQLSTHVIAALVFGVVLIFVVDLALTDRSRAWRIGAMASALVVAYAIFLSDSRNAWFSAVIGVGVYVLARKVKDPQRFAAGVAALTVVLVVLVTALVLNEDTRELVLPRGDSFRLSIWAEIASAIGDHGAWFGLGINTPDNVVVDGWEFLHPHNLYLAIAYQGGLFALTLFAILLAQTLITLLRHYNDHDAKLALGILGLALPAYLLDGHQMIDKVGSTWFLLWLPVGISLGFAWSRPPQEI